MAETTKKQNGRTKFHPLFSFGIITDRPPHIPSPFPFTPWISYFDFFIRKKQLEQEDEKQSNNHGGRSIQPKISSEIGQFWKKKNKKISRNKYLRIKK
jgi:hypothetical protein